MWRYITLFVNLFLFEASFSQNPVAHFKITGTAFGFPDSTVIFLDSLKSFVVRDRFQFAGILKDGAKYDVLRTGNFGDYKFLWVGKGTTTITLKKGDFKNAIIKGSKTQTLQDSLNAAVKAGKSEVETRITFIRNHPNSIISARLLSDFATTWGRDTTLNFYKTLTASVKNTLYGRQVKEFIVYNKNIAIGNKFADFSEPDTAGIPRKLSGTHGKMILLEFWASWCVPCREANPDLVRIYDEFKDAGFTIFGVSADASKDAWIKAIKKDGLKWDNVSNLMGDQDHAVLIYGVSAFPTNFLIDSTGPIIAKNLSTISLEETLTRLLK
jgi:thiol-disulfide isomerase/thioredoxin